MICVNSCQMTSITRMTKRNIAFAVIALLVGIGIFFYKSSSANANDMLAVDVVPFNINGGWGYKIVVDGHTYIYQDVIPGFPGNHVFKTKENALKVGQRVVEKLTHHQLPAMTRQELLAMQINEVK